ncbi:MAG: ABC transporter permease [Thermodesulfobacteriota bacterium]|nr:MAG: ABC transporter permease [Thermodesulfobacteriota bacterium]
MLTYKAIYVITLREFKRFFRQKGRLVVTAARPLIWLFIVGSGFTMLIDTDEVEYIQFILPGIVGMTILFSSIFSTISVVWDREFGFLREMLVSPVSRVTIVFGKLLSGTTLSVFQGAALLLIAPFLGLGVGVLDFLAMFALMALVALAITALGLFVASFLASLEGFNVIMNFIVLPMFFLSGALYPVGSLPPYIKVFAYVNPLCYGVDSFKHVLLPGTGRLAPEFPMLLDIAFVSVFAIAFTFASAFVFERRK